MSAEPLRNKITIDESRFLELIEIERQYNSRGITETEPVKHAIIDAEDRNPYLGNIVMIPVECSFDPRQLKVAMASQGLRQRAIASEIGCHYVTLSMILSGKCDSKNVLRALCKRLGVPLESVVKPVANDAVLIR